MNQANGLRLHHVYAFAQLEFLLFKGIKFTDL